MLFSCKILLLAYLPKILFWIKDNFSQKHINFNAKSVLKKVNLTVWHTCQAFLYVSEAIIYLKAILWVVTEPALLVIRLPPSLPPSLYGSITFTHLEENYNIVKLPYHCLKFSKINFTFRRKPRIVEKPLNTKQLSLNHKCKIGLRTLI